LEASPLVGLVVLLLSPSLHRKRLPVSNELTQGFRFPFLPIKNTFSDPSDRPLSTSPELNDLLDARPSLFIVQLFSALPSLFFGDGSGFLLRPLQSLPPDIPLSLFSSAIEDVDYSRGCPVRCLPLDGFVNLSYV